MENWKIVTPQKNDRNDRNGTLNLKYKSSNKQENNEIRHQQIVGTQDANPR